jgi:hypothetical protein
MFSMHVFYACYLYTAVMYATRALCRLTQSADALVLGAM